MLRLGAPIALTQFFIMAMGFLDTAMAGHYAAVHQAGVGLGGYVLWPTFMLLAGCTMSVTPMVAQMMGAGRGSETGRVVRQGLIVGGVGSVLAVVAVVNGGVLFAAAGVDAVTADVGERYLKAAAFGLPPVMIYMVLRHGAEGLGRTVGPMVIAALALTLNAILNYAFIYGRFGAPELGGEGCGWATAIVMWFELGAIVLLWRRRPFRATGLWQGAEPGRAQEVYIGRILKIGVPIGLSSFVSMGLYAAVGILIGGLGVVPVAAHNIAGHINWATFVAPMALGSAAGIRIGFHVGGGDLAGAARVARTAFLLSIGYAVTISVALVLARNVVVLVYSNDAAVIGVAATLILFIAVYQIFDDAQATMAGSLRGYKDTRVPMLYSVAGYWLLAFPVGLALGYGWGEIPELGVYGFWIGLSVGLAAVAVAMGLRLLSTSRNEERIAVLSR
ncbi:MAG: MATE family efflux transporter [Gammaproteobacteria bacterium]|nr:MATE family efflux transporter [Gammaproteobacteria bacterium]MXY53972.1 MATE family efflux transporter [Gammaproteobacteria bacterium]MYB36663.1 MATE family efflux transporter [Gammaproteobacteria bacterium]